MEYDFDAPAHIFYLFFSGVLFYLSFSDVQNLDDVGALGASKSYSIYFRMIIPFSICNLPTGVGISPPSSFEHSRCFSRDTKGADGAADLLEVLRHSPLEKLNFRDCGQIPSFAWQKLRGASWTNLREANFYECLVLQTWLRCLASSFRRHVS